MALDIHARLLHLFPDYVEGDWVLRDLGAGPFIDEWNRGEPQPPQGLIDAVTPEQRDAANANAKFKKSFQTSDKEKVIIGWIASKHGLTYDDAIVEIRALWDLEQL
jgi:hypothetical protein